MVDLNYLKRINDSYGHDKGNVALVKLSGIICNIFKHSPVFRVGGDEFIIILMGEDFDHLEEREEQFKNTISEIQKDTGLEEWERVSAAIGVSKFTQNDKTIDDVFKRADEAMYKEKTRMKAVRIS
jgi:diguanylate cyclase (GGDEF)-like protein